MAFKDSSIVKTCVFLGQIHIAPFSSLSYQHCSSLQSTRWICQHTSDAKKIITMVAGPCNLDTHLASSDT